MDLLWSHLRKPLQSISPGLQKHCDLGYIDMPTEAPVEDQLKLLLNPVLQFRFDLEVKPNQGGWSIGPGTYRLHLAIAAANASVKRRVLQIEFDGCWKHEEAQMFRESIQIKVLS